MRSSVRRRDRTKMRLVKPPAILFRREGGRKEVFVSLAKAWAGPMKSLSFGLGEATFGLGEATIAPRHLTALHCGYQV